MNLASTSKSTKRGHKDVVTLGQLASIIARGNSIDISESSINRILHAPDYIDPSSVGLFEGKHKDVTKAANIEDQVS